MKKRKKSNTEVVKDIIKVVRKQNREEEIRLYGKPLPKNKIQPSKKIYKRDKKVNLNNL